MGHLEVVRMKATGTIKENPTCKSFGQTGVVHLKRETPQEAGHSNSPWICESPTCLSWVLDNLVLGNMQKVISVSFGRVVQ